LSTPTPGSGTPSIPLTADQRTAYEALYDKNEAAIQGTTDVDLLKTLNDTQLNIGNLLSADDQYHIQQDTAQFKALLTAINTTNDGLKDLKKKIAGVATKISIFGDVLAAVNKVLTLV